MFGDILIGRGYEVKKQPEGQAILSIKKNAGQYIRQYADQGLQVETFKTIMKQKIRQQDRQIDSAPQHKIYKFFPWIFSTSIIPKGFKIILFFQYQKISLDKANYQNFNSVSEDLVQQVLQKAVYASKSFNAPYLQAALSKYADYIQYKNDDSLGFIKKTKQLWGAAWNILLGGNVTIQLLKKMFVSIKQYGKLLINIDYFQKYGSKYNTPAGIIFNLSTLPQLQFILDKGVITVKLKTEYGYQKIPQQSFDESFLRQLIRKRSQIAGSYVIQNFNQQLSTSKDVLSNKAQFISSVVLKGLKKNHKIKKWQN